jgi:SulP family sulfate permease
MPSRLPSRPQIERYLKSLGIVREQGGVRVFATQDSALEWMETRLLEAAGWTARDTDPPLDLAAFTLLAALRPESVAALRGAVEDRSVAAGGAVFGRGDVGEELFLLRRGVVHILLPLEGGQRHHLATFSRGDFFGELAFLDRGARAAHAEAATAVDLYVLPRSAFDAVAREDRALAASLFEPLALVISERLRVTNTELRALELR